MGKQLWINGEQEEYREDKTIGELNGEAGFPSDDIVVYSDGQETVAVSDRNTLGDVPDGARVVSQPGKGSIFE